MQVAPTRRQCGAVTYGGWLGGGQGVLPGFGGLFRCETLTGELGGYTGGKGCTDLSKV